MTDTQNQDYHIALFRGKTIRKTIFNKEWYFPVVDVVQVLIDQPNDHIARKYWNKLAQRLREEGSEVVTNDGKMRETDCANTEGLENRIGKYPDRYYL